MFKELAPLLRHRAVLFTVSHISENQFRVNVVPKKISEGENDALTTPVSVSGTVEDLDSQLPQTLVASSRCKIGQEGFRTLRDSRNHPCGSRQGVWGRQCRVD
jgi:PRTRC genetic system protein E